MKIALQYASLLTTPRLIRKLRIGFGLLVIRLDTIGVVSKHGKARPSSNLAATLILLNARITLLLSEVIKIFMPWLSLCTSSTSMKLVQSVKKALSEANNQKKMVFVFFVG